MRETGPSAAASASITPSGVPADRRDAAGVDGLTAHSSRVGHASELTVRGASTTEVMRSGGWKTSRMIAHYAAEVTAEHGAVAKYL